MQNRPHTNQNFAAQANESQLPSIYVGNLPLNTIQKDIDDIFHGCKVSDECAFINLQVRNVRLVRDKTNDEFKGFAYIDFEDEESMNMALSRDGFVGYSSTFNQVMWRSCSTRRS